jgi:hypothetical protein
MERVQQVPTAASITLEVVCGYREKQRNEEKFKKAAVEPDINDKNWPRTMESIRQYLAAQYGAKGSTLDYVIRQEVEVKPHASDPSENYDIVDLEMTARAPNTGRTFQDDKQKVWDILSNMCAKHPCWVYIKPAQKGNNGRLAYELLFDHYLGPKNVGNMDNAAENKLSSTLYNGEDKRFKWETYARIHTEQHSVLNGLKEYGYSGIDDSSKVRHLLKGINTTELDVCKHQVMAIPTLCDDFTATVELYSTFIKQMKAENPQLNVSEVSYAQKSGGGEGGGNAAHPGCQITPIVMLQTASLTNMSIIL